MTAAESIQPVAAIELYARFGGVHFHHASTDGLGAFYSETQFTWFVLVEDITMIVPRTIYYLLVAGVVDTLAYGVGSTEIKWRSLHLEYFSCRDTCFVDGNKEICINLKLAVQCFGGGIGNASKLEESMARHVYHGFLVGGSTVIDNQFVVLAQTVFDIHVQFAGESFFIIG